MITYDKISLMSSRTKATTYKSYSCSSGNVATVVNMCGTDQQQSCNRWRQKVEPQGYAAIPMGNMTRETRWHLQWGCDGFATGAWWSLLGAASEDGGWQGE